MNHVDRRAIPIDEVFRAIEDAWSDRYESPLPYTESPGNPFGGHHDCPVDGCEVWRATEATLDSHLATEHQVLDRRGVERLNGDRRRLRGDDRARSRRTHAAVAAAKAQDRREELKGKMADMIRGVQEDLEAGADGA